MKVRKKYVKRAACSVMLPIWDTSSMSVSVINEEVHRESFTFPRIVEVCEGLNIFV
jgi:hypothetical protein